MARSSYISNIFGKSPIEPLQLHMGQVYGTVQLLDPFFSAMVAGDWKQVKKLQKKIATGEAKADELKRALRHHLPKGLFMPVDRRDVLDVLLMQDAIANQSKDVAGLVRSRQMAFPTSMHARLMELVGHSIESVGQALCVIDELDDLLETGFRGPEVRRVEGLITDLSAIESKADKSQRKLQNELFDLEADIPPVDTMFMYRLINGIGEIADYAERVGSRLQLMLAR